MAAFPTATVLAQTSVETYIDQAVPDAVDPNLLPEGTIWNRPLKAGDMVLPRLTKPVEKGGAANGDSYPVGRVKGPATIRKQKTGPSPQAAANAASTQGMMLLQGMKSALKQAGQNPDIPPSETVAVDPSQKDKDAAASSELLPSLSSATEKGDRDLAPVPYVKGQEPKALHSSSSHPVLRPAKNGEDGYMDIVFPSEMADAKNTDVPAKTSDHVDAGPKATELNEQPLPLEAAPTKKPSEPGLLERMAKPFSSIFGDAVEEKARQERAVEQKEKPIPAAKEEAAAEPCVESVTRRTRLVRRRYPGCYAGEITGESRKSCPSGDVKDVWLTNTCAEKSKQPSLNCRL